MERKKFVAIIEVTLAVIVWGASFVATKVALQEIAPATVIWLRFGIGWAILGIAVAVRRQFALPDRKDLVYFALLGFIGITFHQWLQATGLQTAQATTTSWIVATTPIFMALLGWAILHEKLSLWQSTGILVAALGVLLVVTKGDINTLRGGKIGTYGDLLVLVSALNWAVFSVLSRRGLQNHPATRMVFFVMGLGWLFSSIMFFTGPGLADVQKLSNSGWASVAFLGIFCSGLAYIFWYDALQALPVAQVGAFVYLEPFVTVIVAALVIAEALLLASLIGGGLILLGVWLVQRK